jgi:hypothetical protein
MKAGFSLNCHQLQVPKSSDFISGQGGRQGNSTLKENTLVTQQHKIYSTKVNFLLLVTHTIILLSLSGLFKFL